MTVEKLKHHLRDLRKAGNADREAQGQVTIKQAPVNTKDNTERYPTEQKVQEPIKQAPFNTKDQAESCPIEQQIQHSTSRDDEARVPLREAREHLSSMP